ncbi:transcriptional regulator [Rothia aeria]|uniref:Transcriptional regulator n=1 Tax=Rothia aeria TaxID=172042 RepID=A0A2Z5R2N7_9MICC|nr:transcriptional regulator [Rothia aeria]
MPRISAATNAAQRENTKRAILESFGKLLYSRGLPGLTMTDVAKMLALAAPQSITISPTWANCW